MRIFDAPRRGGKTTTALSWMLRGEHRHLVVPNDNYSRNVRDVLCRMTGCKNRAVEKRILTVHDVLDCDALKGRRPVSLAIDELDAVLYQVFGAQVPLATLTSKMHLEAPDDQQ